MKLGSSNSPSDMESGKSTVEEEMKKLLTSETPQNPSSPEPAESPTKADAPIVSSLGLRILTLLAFQNCFKNLLMRFIMKDKPDFLTSAAVIGVEVVKLILCVLYIVIIDRRSLWSIIEFMKDDYKHAILLTIPAAAYSFQMSMEYVALANLDAAIFSVLVQSKLLTTASFSAVILRKRFKFIQIVSLILLTVGVMLININNMKEGSDDNSNNIKGVMATLGIAVSSGFASVYTEKVIKAQRSNNVSRKNYSLAYMQVQLALVSLVILGIYAVIIDYEKIRDNGLLHNFTTGAFVSVFNSAIGGLTVAAVLKYADSVLKSYATAISVVMTGVLSMILFGTQLNAIYGLGIVNVVCAVLLYNGKNLDKLAC
eukprot:CAMPEP_0178912550 /NCGR_PEP_ID=MMETSP0786-20121207/10332_1 /TAXON_ID=186022 /ORGANISM="Thalassionema frauenfeldii, Strain CCMP 1798" /LENGTH=369 /DNA_ID=CAMNT_0020585159 /DNA_START=49 /DNA_END=1158 /DNA_ORIENTATION=+